MAVEGDEEEGAVKCRGGVVGWCVEERGRVPQETGSDSVPVGVTIGSLRGK